MINANGEKRVSVRAVNEGGETYRLEVSPLDNGRFRESNSNELVSGDMAKAMDDCIEKSLAAARE